MQLWKFKLNLPAGTSMQGWMQDPEICSGRTIQKPGVKPYVFCDPFEGIVPVDSLEQISPNVYQVRAGVLIQIFSDSNSNTGRLVYTDKAMPVTTTLDRYP